jgi:hypothetical protein
MVKKTTIIFYLLLITANFQNQMVLSEMLKFYDDVFDELYFKIIFKIIHSFIFQIFIFAISFFFVQKYNFILCLTNNYTFCLSY